MGRQALSSCAVTSFRNCLQILELGWISQSAMSSWITLWALQKLAQTGDKFLDSQCLGQGSQQSPVLHILQKTFPKIRLSGSTCVKSQLLTLEVFLLLQDCTINPIPMLKCLEALLM